MDALKSTIELTLSGRLWDWGAIVCGAWGVARPVCMHVCVIHMVHICIICLHMCTCMCGGKHYCGCLRNMRRRTVCLYSCLCHMFAYVLTCVYVCDKEPLVRWFAEHGLFVCMCMLVLYVGMCHMYVCCGESDFSHCVYITMCHTSKKINRIRHSYSCIHYI
jgi:hypothetical protein